MLYNIYNVEIECIAEEPEGDKVIGFLTKNFVLDFHLGNINSITDGDLKIPIISMNFNNDLSEFFIKSKYVALPRYYADEEKTKFKEFLSKLTNEDINDDCWKYEEKEPQNERTLQIIT